MVAQNCIKKITLYILLIVLILFLSLNIFRYVTSLKSTSVADQHFQDIGWGGYQIARTEMTKLTDKDFSILTSNIIKRFKKFALKNSKLIKSNRGFKTFLKNYCAKGMDNINDTVTFYILKHVKTIGFISNHANCDGIIMYTFLGLLFNFTDKLKAPKYMRIPIISEYNILEYCSRILLKSYSYKTLTIESKNRRYSISYSLNNRKRWGVYAKVIQTLFIVLDKNVQNLRIAFTVSWNDVTTRVNNRLGAIIIDIPRLKTEAEYKRHIKCEIIKYELDALTSYELVKSYYVPTLRKEFSNKIDAVISSFIIPCNVPGICNYFGGFVGDLVQLPLYISSMSGIKQTHPVLELSIQTRSPLFNEAKFMKINNTTKSYRGFIGS